MEQPGDARPAGAFAMLLRQAIGETSDAERVGETMFLRELLAYGARECDET